MSEVHLYPLVLILPRETIQLLRFGKQAEQYTLYLKSFGK